MAARQGRRAPRLPRPNDLADAALVAAVANGLREWRALTGTTKGSLKPLREAVWFYWQHPRLPRPLVRSKYPTTVPWSSAARSAFRADPQRTGGLVIEHSYPIALLLDELLTAPELDAEVALRLLRRCRDFVVITVEENRSGAGEGPSRRRAG